MGNVIHEIYDIFKRNEKEMLIQKSGSTKDAKNEKIRSGQSYLYKQYGMESEVIEVRFKKKVSGSYLNQALITSMHRYPYFNTKLVEKDGDFYIIQNEHNLLAKRKKELAKLGHISCGYHLIDVTFYEYSIYISFHHALCDGRGIMPFVETLIYYYCNLKYGIKPAPKGVRLADEDLLPKETFDPFLQEYDFDNNKEFINLSRDAYVLPENKTTEKCVDYRYELKISASEYMKVCKENNATPVILLSLLMSHAISVLDPTYAKPINANIATDMRDALHASNTFKNCVKSMILPYSRVFSKHDFSEQAIEYRSLLKAQRDEDYCRKEANAMIGLFNKLDNLNSYEKKQSIMSFYENMTLNTYVVSYLGEFKLGEHVAHIDDIHLYNSGTSGLGINMIACGENFIIDFKQSFSSNKYVQAFCRELDKQGITYQVSDKILFCTPCDSLIKRDSKYIRKPFRLTNE